MKVAFVASDLGPASGGLGTMTPELARALGQEGVEVTLHCVGDAPGLAGDLDVRPHVRAWPVRLARSPSLAHALQNSSPDVIHAHGLWQCPLRYATSAAAHHAVPLVISPRGMLAPWALARSRSVKLIARLLLHPTAFRRAAGYHATSRHEAGDIRSFAPDAPICEAPFGVRQPSQAEREAGLAELRARLRGLAGQRVLLFYSRFHSAKGIVRLLEWFVGLSRAHRDWHLLAVGLPEEYSEGHLEAHVARTGLEGRVTIRDGRTLPAPYPIADLFVLPSKHESYGAVVAEALSWGVPVVATTGTPWAELPEAGAGRWVDPDDLPNALDELMSMGPDELGKMGAKGLAWVLRERNWSAPAETLRRFYEQLVASGPSPFGSS